MEEAERTAAAQGDAQPHHLCVLIHGLWGTPDHLKYMVTALKEKHPGPNFHVLVCKRNAGYSTYDGIERGGERTMKEFEEALDTFKTEGIEIKKISVVGYSLGGLVARYFIGLAYWKGYFDKIEPVNFTTFASPHLGVRTPVIGYQSHVWNFIGSSTLSTSGKQLFLIDTFRDTGRPLLSVLADPDRIFIRALKAFKHRSLYANIVNDRSAVWYTTGISRTDPYTDLSAVKLNYLPDTDNILLDPDHPTSKPDPRGSLSLRERLSESSQEFFSNAPRIAIMSLLFPVGSVVFLLNSGLQTIQSNRRIRDYDQGESAAAYRLPLMAQEMQHVMDDVMEELNQNQQQQYLPEGADEQADRSDPHPSQASAKQNGHANGHANGHVNGSAKKGSNGTVVTTKSGADPSSPLPTLALLPAQFEMIDALDATGFRKFPVHIHKCAHSHAAIIVRMPYDRYTEGKVVIRHWLNEVFEV